MAQAQRTYPSIEDYLGPAEGRFFSCGFRRSEHQVSQLVLAPAADLADGSGAGARAVASIRYPADWSVKTAGTDLRPHLSTVDTLVIAVQLAEAHLAHAHGLDDSLRAAMRLRKVTIRAGAAPQEDLAGMACSATPRGTVPGDIAGTFVSVYDCAVGNMRARCVIEHSSTGLASHEATYDALEDALGSARQRYYGTGFKNRQHYLEDVRVDMTDLRSAASVLIDPGDPAMAGIEGTYQPALSMIDCFVVSLQLAQVLMYEMDSISRQDSNTLWMVKTILEAARPDRPITGPLPAEAAITASRLLPLRGATWRSVDISAECGGIGLRASFAHEVPGRPAASSN